MNRENEPGFLLNFLPLRASRPLNMQFARRPCLIIALANHMIYWLYITHCLTFILNDPLRLYIWLYSFLSACLSYPQFEQDTSFFKLFSSYVSFFKKKAKRCPLRPGKTRFSGCPWWIWSATGQACVLRKQWKKWETRIPWFLRPTRVVGDVHISEGGNHIPKIWL